MENNLGGDPIRPRKTDIIAKSERERQTKFGRKLLSEKAEPQVGTHEEHATIVTKLEAKGKGKGVASPIERANSVAGEASNVTNTQDQSISKAHEKLLEIQQADPSKRLKAEKNLDKLKMVEKLIDTVRNLTREYPDSHPKFQVDINQLHASKKALEDAYLKAKQNLENRTVSIENLRTIKQLLTKFLTHERYFKELLRSELEVIEQSTDIETVRTYLQHEATYPANPIRQLDQDYSNYTRALNRANNAEDRIPEERRVYYLLEVYDDLRTNSYRLSEGLGYFQRYNEARKKLDELGTLYNYVNNLWEKYNGDLEQVFPKIYKEIFGQLTNFFWEKLANPEQWLEQFEHHTEALQQLEREKQQLTKISDLCSKIEKVHPVLTPFNQICQYLMPIASSQNTEQILKNLNEPSGDSLLVRKIREAFGQDFREFQKHLQDIDMSIRTMDIISKASKALKDDTQWLAEKLGGCEGAKERLITELKHKGFSENTVSELTALTLKGPHGIYNTTYERIQAYMDSLKSREEMRKVIPPQKLEDIRKTLLDASYLKGLEEKEQPQKSEDLIAHHARLSKLLKHFQVLETALSNQDALSEVRGFILHRDACHYQENITRGSKVFQVDTLSTDKLEEISNHLNNDLEQINNFIQDKIEKLKYEIHRLNQKTSKYLLYIEEAKSQAYGYHEGTFSEEFIIQLKTNDQIYKEKEITLGIPDQGSIADLQKRYNDLDTTRKDFSRALKTYEEPFLQDARSILREIDLTLKACSELEDEEILSVKQDQEGRKEIPFHDLISGYRSALEDACIAYHFFPTTERTIKELLEDFVRRFEQVYQTDQGGQESSSPISYFQMKMELIKDNLEKKLKERQSDFQQMQIPEREISHAQKKEDIKTNNLIYAQKKLKELGAINTKLQKYWNKYFDKIQQDFSEEFNNSLNLHVWTNSQYQNFSGSSVKREKWRRNKEEVVR